MDTKASDQNLTLLNEREIARRLGVSPHALRYWRAHGGGPPWVRVGKRLVRYDVFKLRKWIERQAVRDDSE
jgi:DNA-binding transcriptional MerR regulator